MTVEVNTTRSITELRAIILLKSSPDPPVAAVGEVSSVETPWGVFTLIVAFASNLGLPPSRHVYVPA